MKFPHKHFPHTQKIYFDNGSIRTLREITRIEEGKWTHIFCKNESGGEREVIINPKRVLFIEIS